MTTVEQIADAILYEGYILYPYRASALKNGQRWNFGVLYPPEYPAAQRGGGVEAVAPGRAKGTAARRGGGAVGGCARWARCAARGKRGGHQWISAICCSPSVTSAPLSGWKPKPLRFDPVFPVVMIQCRKDLIALALAASGCADFTTAYS